MARVTVEDCVVQVPNRFDLAILAAQRSRELTSGATLTVDRDNDKNPVVALREIAERTVSVDTLRDAVVKGHQRHLESDEPEEEVIELMAGEEEALSQRPANLGPDGVSSDEVSLEALEEDSGDGADQDNDDFAEDDFASDDLPEEGLAADDADGESDALDDQDLTDDDLDEGDPEAEDGDDFGDSTSDQDGSEDPITG